MIAKKNSLIAAKKTVKTAAKAGVKAGKGVQKACPWLIEVISRIPLYIKLLIKMGCDNRVDSKFKLVVITTLWVLVTSICSGPLFWGQWAAAFIFGPWAWLPTVIIFLIGLDITYQLVDVDTNFEKELFGDGDTVQNDINRLQELLGKHYGKVKKWFLSKLDKYHADLEAENEIQNGELSDTKAEEIISEVLEKEDEIKERVEDFQKTVKGKDLCNKKLEQKLKKFLEHIDKNADEV